MPYINTRTNVSITKAQETEIKRRLGEAVACLGKSERYLMVDMEENCRLYFDGDTKKPAAFVEVRLFGRASADAYDAMTEEVTDILSGILNIPADRIYVQYQEVPHWGWNGVNF